MHFSYTLKQDLGVALALLIKSFLDKPIPSSFSDTNSPPEEQVYLAL
jgi:hypothetical protein